MTSATPPKENPKPAFRLGQIGLLPFVLALFLFALSLFSYGVYEADVMGRYAQDINKSGSLRYRSLWLFGATDRSTGEDWQAVLQQMTSLRFDLKRRYPEAVKETEATWTTFSQTLLATGRVDWRTANKMRGEFDRLTQKIEATSYRQRRISNYLFLAGIFGAAVCSSIAFAFAQRLRATEAQLRLQSSVPSSSQNGIIICDAQEGIVYVNPAFERMSGYSLQETLGKQPREIVQGPLTDIATKQRLRAALQAREPVTAEILNYHRSGRPYWVSLHIAPVFNESGALTHFVAIQNDITEQRHANERFRVLFEHSSDAHLLFDDTGIIDCNQATIEMLRCKDKAEVLSLHPAALSPEFQPDGRASMEKCIEMDATARERGYHRFEWMHRKADGTDFPVEVTLTPVLLDGKDALLVVWHDLTERKQAEEAVRQSEARLRDMVENLPAGAVFVEGAKVYLNRGAEELTGYSREELPDIDAWFRTIYPDNTAEIYAFYLQHKAANFPTNPAVPIRCKDGTTRQVEFAGYGYAGGEVWLLHDVTQRMEADERIRRSEANLNLAQAMAHVGSWERDYRTATMSWSDELFRLCGLKPGEIAPTMAALVSFTHPLDRQRALERMQQAMREGKGVELDLRIVGADSALRYVHVRTEIILDAEGQPNGSYGTLTDVTERVEALQAQTKFVSLIENSNDFIAMTSLDGVLLSMNPAGRRLVGLERMEEVVTTMLPDFIPVEVWNQMRQEALPTVVRDDRWEGECQLVNVATGKVHDMQASFFLIRNPMSGEPMCMATVQRDITERKWLDAQLHQNLTLVQDQNVVLEAQRLELEAANAELEAVNQQLEGLATTDGLTGAKNHRAFQERLADELKRVERNRQPLSVILLDVDKFKQYNDSFGHPEGDRVLQRVVKALQSAARETDYIARYGGEEFVILLPETGAAGAVEAAERFRLAIESQAWTLRPVTASFGVATLGLNAEGETAQPLVEAADKALYVSKTMGRNRVTLADQSAFALTETVAA